MGQHYEIMDYYTHIYEQYGKIKNIQDNHARKIVKKVIMTINYGLTALGCHRYIYKLLKEFNYCVSKVDYKKN
jgi:DNA-directed RNA polymerase